MIVTNFINNKIETKPFTTENYTHQFMTGADLSSTNSQLKLSAVYACIDILSNSIGELPFFCIDTNTHKRVDSDIKYLLSTRPNKNMTPFIYHKLTETNVLIKGNAYSHIDSNARTGKIEQLTPLNPDRMQTHLIEGEIFYDYTQETGVSVRYLADEIIHIKGLSFDGFVGQSVLNYARTVIETALSQEDYSKQFYGRGGRPQGTLETASDLGKVAQGKDGKSAREILRESWEKANSGITNANRIAILDNGVKYNPVAQISQRDMAFVESKEISVADIARFFRVPLYMLQAGKESYSSNEQNAIGYVTNALRPKVTQYEQEYTIKGLSEAEQQKGISVKANLKMLLRGDIAAQTTHYDTMLKNGVYNINTVLDLEDLPTISVAEGGEIRMASLNNVPLEDFKRLSLARNQPKGNV